MAHDRKTHRHIRYQCKILWLAVFSRTHRAMVTHNTHLLPSNDKYRMVRMLVWWYHTFLQNIIHHTAWWDKYVLGYTLKKTPNTLHYINIVNWQNCLSHTHTNNSNLCPVYNYRLYIWNISVCVRFWGHITINNILFFFFIHHTKQCKEECNYFYHRIAYHTQQQQPLPFIQAVRCIFHSY
jgi:hypothetical protein